MIRCCSLRLGLRNNKRNSRKFIVETFYHTKHGVFGYKPDSDNTRNTDLLPPNPDDLRNCNDNANLLRYVTAFREHGHRIAKTDPLNLTKYDDLPVLTPDFYSLTERQYCLKGILSMGRNESSLREITEFLQETYSSNIGVEFHYIADDFERRWFAEHFETLRFAGLPRDRKLELCRHLLKSQTFERFLGSKFSTIKRYGGEGAESMLVVFNEIFNSVSEYNINQVLFCIPHRGRLSLMAVLLNFPVEVMFQKMRGLPEFPEGAGCSGDILTHLYTSVDIPVGDRSVHVSMIPNPSHLEANNPVIIGKTRGRLRSLRLGPYSLCSREQEGDVVLPVQVHGDAACSAQGVIAELVSMATVPHYSVEGSVHLIVNNQLGFTTERDYGRSSRYASDFGKITGCPVIHVNGACPEEVVMATRLALAYRNALRKDVIVDLVCFRRWGHNEIDDPRITQPIMYSVIDNRKSIPDSYAEKLIKENIISVEEVNDIDESFSNELNDKLKGLDSYKRPAFYLDKQWFGLVQPGSEVTQWDSGFPVEALRFIGGRSVATPTGFNLHPRVGRAHCDGRVEQLRAGRIDWATAEALAVGSLLVQGFDVRLSGQDVGRGTFSHRHAMLVDQETDEIIVPLNDIVDKQKGFLEVCNSTLSEEAVLGFEYGISIESPQVLPIWEAQFGDFFNGAQIILDTYVASGELKWLQQSGLVLLLPHGMDGAGPDHSSCRVERFLQMSDSRECGIDGDSVNWFVANPTTPAQYFHLLRRQMMRNFRKPLVVMAPKVLIRLPEAGSPLADLAPGTSFQPVLDDPAVLERRKVKRLIFVCGKHYYALGALRRETRIVAESAVIRVEELCPFPTAALQRVLAGYPAAREFVWAQEEHRNQGVWQFVAPRFANNVGIRLGYVGRAELAASAVGIGVVHKAEAEVCLRAAFGLKGH